MEKITLSKPFKWEGVEYKSIDLALDDMTGRDLISAEKESRAMGDRTPVAEFSKLYLATVAAKAAKLPSDMLLALPARDFTAVTSLVQGFFMQAG